MRIRPVPAGRGAAAHVVGVTSDGLGRRWWGGDQEPPWRFLSAQGFTGELGQAVPVPSEDGVALVVGLGAASAVGPAALRSAAAVAARAARRSRSLAVDLAAAATSTAPDDALRALAEGAALGAHQWHGYRSKPPERGLGDIQLVHPEGKVGAGTRAAVRDGVRSAEAANFAKDLVNEPGGMLTAAEFAAQVAIAASAGGVACTVHDEAAIRELGFGGLLAVNKGSAEPPRFVELIYEPPGADGSTPTVVLVGKGITFDSGGYSIKTAEGMTTMKSDMGGGAAVAAALCAAGDLALPVALRGLVPLTDNMIGSDAQRVGDVITHYGGSTTEVLNTDAEGRLVLADVLAWASEPGPDRPAPAAVLDLATLTGACIVGLGTRTAGLWANDDDLAGQVLGAAAVAGERVWRMPLVEPQRRDLESKVADRKNVGGGRYGGAITAALYLRDFVAAGVPWAHLDIAGPAFNEGAEELEVPAGGTGFGVRTLLELLRSWPT